MISGRYHTRRRGVYRWRRTLSWLDLASRLLTIFSAFLLVLVLLAPYVSPRFVTFFAFLALAAPFVWLVNLFFLLFWIFRWHRIVFFVALPMFFSLYVLGDFLQLQFLIHNEPEGSLRRGTLSVVSYNTHSMGRYLHSPTQFGPIVDSLLSLNADLVLLQEFSVSDAKQLSHYRRLASRYAFREFSRGEVVVGSPSGVLTLSKQPIFGSEYHPVKDSDNGVLRTDIVVGADTLRVLNCHLQSNQLGFLSRSGSGGVLWNFGEVASSLRRNFSRRSVQADLVSFLSDVSPHAMLIGGDMNTPPQTYSYRRVRGDLSDSFCGGGVGYSSTYRRLGGFLRIDYVFYPGMVYQCIDYQTLGWVFSDHKPVYVQFKKR